MCKDEQFWFQNVSPHVHNTKTAIFLKSLQCKVDIAINIAMITLVQVKHNANRYNLINAKII